MALFASETWTMRHRLLLTIGSILVVCQLISVFWLWHESKEQIQLLVASAIEGHNNQKHVEHEVREAVASLLIPSLLIVGLALYISLVAVRKITRPLSNLQTELESRTPDNLQPITLTESVPEVTAVTTAINQLVSRLNLTLDRERLFTADVAHELRTPLAGLRLHLELMAKVHHVEVSQLIQRLDQMTNSISQLLQLARVGQSFSAGSYQRVLLQEDVVEPIRGELESMLEQRQQTLELALPDGDDAKDVVVSGDATLLRVVLRNLVENAHRYSPAGSKIKIAIQAGTTPVMAVEDEGPGIDEAKSGELSKAFDLSVGSLLALTGAIAASIVGIEVNALVAVAAALAAGAAIGAVTGVIVAKGRVQAFIATLVMMLLLRGVTMVYTNGSPVNTGFTENADLFGWFGIGRPLGIPTPVWIMAIVFLAAWYMLHHTRLGRYIYALGGNESATRLSGISVNKVKIIVYSLCGLLASLAGIIEVARLSSAQPTAGTGYELDAIAAVVLGGTSLAGGKGRIVGTLIGALILGFLNNGLNLLGVSSYYQMIVKAVVILLAVLVDNKKQ